MGVEELIAELMALKRDMEQYMETMRAIESTLQRIKVKQLIGFEN